MATLSIIVSRPKNIRTDKGKIAPLESPKRVPANKTTRTKNEVSW
jgi:hypothetical protein